MSAVARLSGTQITTIAVSVCLAVIAAPVAVAASTGSFVNIVDPSNAAHKAAVTAFGGVVTSQRDPSNGSFQRVDAGAARVTGTVSTNALVPAGALSRTTVSYSANPPTLTVLPAGKAFTLTDVSLDNFDPSGYAHLTIVVYTPSSADPTCTGSTGNVGPRLTIAALGAAAYQTTSLSFRTPVVVAKASAQRCILEAASTGSYGAYVNMSGFLS